MASIINASTAGVGGVITTADNSGDLNIQSGSTTILAITSTGASVTGTLSASAATTFSAGSVSAPAITTTGDTNTGIFFPAADAIAFSEGGVESMRIDSAGNVGIGTTLPVQKLEVLGNSGLATGTGNPIAIRISDTSADAGAATWNTTTDFTQLQFYSADASGPGGANIRYTVGAVMEGVSGQTTALTFRSSSLGVLTERMRIDANGNVGVGVTPSAWQSSSKAIQLTGGSIAGLTTTDFRLYANAYENSGAVYVTTNVATMYRMTSGSHVWYTAPSGTAGTAVTWTTGMTLTAGGDLELGTGHYYALFTATDFGIELRPTLATSGAVFASFLNNTGTRIGSISRNTTTNAVLYNTTSDERLKENIADSNPVLETISKIKVRQYDWKDANVHQDYGFIAQELDTVIDGVVTKPDDAELMWSVDYSKITPHLVKAIQEQQAMIEELKAEIDLLKGVK
jgi:hypothetical protein